MGLGGSKSDFKVEIIETGAKLQAKVGKGEISAVAVERGQTVLNNNKVDYAPIAWNFTKDLSSILDTAHKKQDSHKVLAQEITAIVMQIKASASVFGYPLISRIADITLNFLERVNTLDDDIIKIVEALHKSTEAIILGKMKGDGGACGTQLEMELYNACQRYYTKYK